MRIVVLAGGIGGARFLRGLRTFLAAEPDHEERADAEVTVIGNTGDDITLFGLRICPDLDTVMYTLGGGIHEEQGWGRSQETFAVADELRAYDVPPDWFSLGDRDFATHIVRTQMLRSGWPLSDVTAALCQRWLPGVRLLPMSDDPIETHVIVNDEAEGRKALHFQEWWVRHHATQPAQEFVFIGADVAKPAPGVLDAIGAADMVILPPSNPVVSIGAILQVAAIREALVRSPVPVVGVSPIIGGAPVRGMADACLAAIGVATDAGAVASHYGARRDGGILDAWIVAEEDRGAELPPGVAGICRPLLMSDVGAAAAIAQAAVETALELCSGELPVPG